MSDLKPNSPHAKAPDRQTSTTTTSESHTLTSEQAAAALNEHGFLLQQAVREKIKGYTNPSLDLGVRWGLEGYEYPVQAPDGSETTIDLLLKGGSTYLCLECKRPHPDYKHWLFFESSTIQNDVANHTFFEASARTMDNSCRRRIDRSSPNKVASFKHFLEVSLSKPANEGRVNKKPDNPVKERVARTDGLHAALRQAITATSGLMTKVLASGATAKAVPVIVTTAQLYECHYSLNKIDSQTGTIPAADIQLAQHQFVSIQYSAPESLALKDLTTHERAPGINDLVNSILRTVYIVRVHKINDFLNWAGHNLV